MTLDGHKDWVWKVKYSPNGRMLATASKDGSVVWVHVTATVVRQEHELHVPLVPTELEEDGQ